MAQFNCDGCGCKVSDVDVQCPKCNAPIGKLQIVCKVCGCVLFERNATLLENNVFPKRQKTILVLIVVTVKYKLYFNTPIMAGINMM